ncbi:MAG: Rrf2 family transcriptional regulator [Deltaproteobacteria bacterium]|nr:Rrf2 family transcriptional regulator [Deltaproteobacteria bacterium]
MLITKKNQYALRAVFELARQQGKGPIKISNIAETQAIPERFLEVILGQLRKSGFVKSKRGYQGGYELVPSPDELTVGDIMRFLHKDLETDLCMAPIPESNCPFQDSCAFSPMWKQVREAMFKVYDGTSIQDLLNNDNGVEVYPV